MEALEQASIEEAEKLCAVLQKFCDCFDAIRTNMATKPVIKIIVKDEIDQFFDRMDSTNKVHVEWMVKAMQVAKSGRKIDKNELRKAIASGKVGPIPL